MENSAELVEAASAWRSAASGRWLAHDARESNKATDKAAALGHAHRSGKCLRCLALRAVMLWWFEAKPRQHDGCCVWGLIFWRPAGGLQGINQTDQSAQK